MGCLLSIIDSRRIDGFICGWCMMAKDRLVRGSVLGMSYTLSGIRFDYLAVMESELRNMANGQLT